jgi:hypothetical protein
MSWQIYAAGNHYHQVDDALPELKALTAEVTGKSFRRIGRFIQLALIGASRCIQDRQAPADTGVYLASGRGDLELTLEIMTQLFRDAQTPKPLNFVNTVSNAACFYLAQHLQLQARSNFVCNRYFAFESVLQLAALDLSMGTVNSALVGSVDIATMPLAEHRLRLQLLPDTLMGEGSHWLWLGPVDAQRPRLGELVAVQHCSDRNELLDWIKQQDLSQEHCRIAAGQFVAADDFARITTASGLQQSFEYRHERERGHYDSQSGAVIHAFLNNISAATQLLHINADSDQRFSAMLIKR